MGTELKIWIDGDAAPRAVKEIVMRAAERRKVQAVFVANRTIVNARSTLVQMVQVHAGDDVADDYIAENCVSGDLVITADIPLAARAVEKGALVLEPRGGVLTEANVRQRLAMRDFKEELRANGVMTGGPPPFNKKDVQSFANALDRWLTSALRTR